MELPSASSPGSSPLQTHSSAAAAAAAASSRSRCHPVICGDVMRLETIRERNSAYSEDGGEFIDLPLPPVPPPIQKPALPPPRRIHGAAPPAPEELVEPAVCKQPMGYDGLMSRAANDYLCSRLRDFEEEDGPIGNGFIGEGDCVEEIILKPTISDDDDGTRGGRTFPEQEDGLKSIDSSRSNTLRKSSWSVTSTASTGEGAGDGDDGYRYRYADESGSDDEEDDGEDGERLSGYRDKSPFLRSISQSPVERRYQRRQQTATVAASHHHRRRKPPSSSGPSGHPAEPSSSSGGGSSSGQRRHRRSRSGEQQQECEADDSTCCDDDFTWVRTQGRGEAPKASVESDRRSSSRATTAARSVARDQHQRAGSVALTQSAAQSLQRQTSADAAGPSSGPSGKPPRPARETGGSLDRRRHLSSSSRHERDSKSRSTHSLKEKSSSSEFPKHESMSSNVSLNSKEHHHDSGSYNHYNSSGSGSQHHHPTHRPQPTRSQRQSPSIWEPPPPPPLSHWDPHYYWGYQHHQQHQSREELRLIDHYHRRQQELYRYGSSSALGSSQDLSCAGGGCCNRNYYPPPPPLPAPGSCCSCDHHRSHWNTDGQRQDTDERLRRLQTDKEALALQVKTLTEQVQTLTAKIGDLERTVKEKNQLLANAEDLLQREMLSRSSLETQKLELMSAMSELKLQQAALERENLELRTNFVTSSSGSMGLMNGSLTNGTGTAVLSNVLNNNSITPGLLRRPQIITNTRMVGMSASTPGTSLTSSPMHHGSHGSLPQPAISPITPKTPPATYRQRVDVHYSSLPRQAFATTLSTVSTSSGSSTATDSNANPKRNVAFGKCLPTLETYLTRAKDDEQHEQNIIETDSSATVAKQSAGSKSTYPPIGMSSSMDALALAAALRRTEETNLTQMKAASCSTQQLLHDQSDRPVGARTIADLAHSSYQDTRDPIQRANTEPPSPKGADDDHDGDTASNSPTKTHQMKSQEKPPASRFLLPAALSSERQWHEPIDKRRGFSVPNLAETENANEDRTDGSLPPRSFTPQPAPSPSMSNKLKTIFGKIKRSNSGTLDDLSGAEGEFKRGGVRATAGARLGWSGTAPYRQPEKPFREWPLDALCHWFDHLGLGMYEEDLRRWLGVGSTAPAAELLKASPVDVEKELNLRHPMHRKKIVLALADIGGTEEEDELFKNAGKLDTAWILRWLEDVGLPQYRDTFTAARVDGRMLHKLTMDDLVHLQVSSCLHVASLRRAIQVMRSEKWNADCLVRRPLPPDTSHAGKDEVRLWTALRVHEWLRAVDLAEYSPNLRGSGVHGALMVFEVKFTAELFADLLSIPSSKTLLRRHLATHFKDLLGRDVIQVKREAENTLGFQPLTISAKIKTPKKSQFSLKRKKSTKGQLGGDEWSDYVCPMGGSDDEESISGINCLSRQHHQQQHQHNYFRSRVGACFTSTSAADD